MTKNDHNSANPPALPYGSSDAVGTSVPIEKMNMMQRIRYISDYFFALAERERKKGDRADVKLIFT